MQQVLHHSDTLRQRAETSLRWLSKTLQVCHFVRKSSFVAEKTLDAPNSL